MNKITAQRYKTALPRLPSN